MSGINCNPDATNGNFLCGVVEGFYGRPWTSDQRKVLFKRMKKMGMNTYMYAPKDDCKHRAFWRDLYSVEEADHLTGLIEDARQCDVTFVYSLSPGLDITFSSSKEVTCLKRKLEQVATFGCKAFALLFDDIEPEMHGPDKEVFQSFAQAQVSVTNEVYQHLGQPRFLFCPTEYCASRAVPDVSNSEYLVTIGSKLLPAIDVMWTGPKVISKRISVQSVEDVSKVLKRPPVIWDNYHANDYDQKRLFLGPYDGRSPDLIPYLHGVLTNPNCEFEANYIPLHTLAQWSHSNQNGVKKDIVSEESPVNSDIKLETETEYSSEEDIPSKASTTYQPKSALRRAIKDWITEIHTVCNPAVLATAPLPKPEIQMPSTCGPVTPVTNSCPPSSAAPFNAINDLNNLTQVEGNDSYMQPVMNPVNALGSSVQLPAPTCAPANELEPMDCVPTPPGSSPVHSNEYNDVEIKPDTEVAQSVDVSKSNHSGDGNETVMQIETSAPEETSTDSNKNDDCMTFREVSLLVDLFYLPFEHGSQAVHLLTEFHWLKTNSHVVEKRKLQQNSPPLELEVEWRERSVQFEKDVQQVHAVAEKLLRIPNRALLYDLYPYLWDMRGVLSLLTSFIKWLAGGYLPFVCSYTLQGGYTWCTKGYREAFMSGDQEPWIFRGGLAAEFQRMLPIDGAHDLFHNIPPLPPVPQVFTIRPYLPADESAVYEVCRLTCDDGADGTEVFPGQPDLIGDKLVGGFLTVSPMYSFVLEDGDGICGYALAALDSKDFNRKLEVAWISAMCTKYCKPEKTDSLTPAEEIITSFHNHKVNIPSSLHSKYPSVIKLDVVTERVKDFGMVKRLLACTLSALKANGSSGVYCEVSVGDRRMCEFYAKLGFFDVPKIGQISDDMLVLVRAI